jgi:hypothetical protein
MSDATVAGESAQLLLEALLRMDQRKGRDGMVHGSWRLEPRLGIPLVRALMRIEAELLLGDADAYGSAQCEERTQPRRAADAFVTLTLRLGDALGLVA